MNNQIYLTSEQAHRISALACDSLIGMQITSDCSDQTYALVHMVDFEQNERHYEIEPDGTIREVT